MNDKSMKKERITVYIYNIDLLGIYWHGKVSTEVPFQAAKGILWAATW